MDRMKITTIPVFKNTRVGALGTAGTILSDIVDLRDVSAQGNFSLTYGIASTSGVGTAGSSIFEALVCATREGTFVTGGTFGTQGNGPAQAGILTFSPPVAPFMRVKAVSGTSAPAVITAELNIR